MDLDIVARKNMEETLPPEMWTPVVLLLRHSDWLTLSTTCRYLNRVVSPHLFNRIVLGEANTDDLFLVPVGFFEVFQTKPDICLLARELRVEYCENTWDTFHELHRFRDLTKLEFDYTHVTRELRESVFTLPCLSDISFSHCRIDPLSLGEETRTPSLKAVSFSGIWCLNEQEADAWAWFLSSGTRHVRLAYLHANTVSMSIFMNSLQKSVAETLQGLVIQDVWELDAFLSFIIATRSLTALSVPKGFNRSRHDGNIALPPQCLPRLHDLEGDPILVQLLLPGRQLRRIIVKWPWSYDSDTPTDIIRGIRHCPQVHYLEIVVDFGRLKESIILLAQSVPGLRSLMLSGTFGGYEYKDDYVDCFETDNMISALEAFTAFHSLQTLRMNNIDIDLLHDINSQRSLCIAAGKACSTLCEVQFERAAWWELSFEGKWERFRAV